MFEIHRGELYWVGDVGRIKVLEFAEVRPILRGYKAKHVLDAALEHSRTAEEQLILIFTEAVDTQPRFPEEGLEWPQIQRARKGLKLRYRRLVLE